MREGRRRVLAGAALVALLAGCGASGGSDQALAEARQPHLPARGMGEPAWWTEIEREAPRESDGHGCRTTLVVPSDLLFAVDRHEVSDGGRAALAAIADELVAHDGPIEVVGHTDRTGPDDRGQHEDLSRRRATAVAQLLVTSGIPAERLEVRGAGSTAPRSDTPHPTAEDHARDRRVELLLRCHEPTS